MIAIFDNGSTWLFSDETIILDDYKKLISRKDLYIGWLINTSSTCKAISEMSIKRFFVDCGKGKLMELSREEAIDAYQLFDERFNKEKCKRLNR